MELLLLTMLSIYVYIYIYVCVIFTFTFSVCNLCTWIVLIRASFLGLIFKRVCTLFSQCPNLERKGKAIGCAGTYMLLNVNCPLLFTLFVGKTTI